MAVVTLQTKRIHTHPDPGDGEVFWLEVTAGPVTVVCWTWQQAPRHDGFTFFIRSGMRRVHG